MKKRYYVLIFVIAFIAFISYTGGCEFSSATVSNAKVCTTINQKTDDRNGKQAVAVVLF